ncbi:MAG: hypothetical protein AABX89_01960 [Candidatus Thermoplasmatota archaeon]
MAPVVQAGTEQNPEVTDATDDSDNPIPGDDLGSFWIDDVLGATSEGAPALVFRLKVGGDFNHRPALFALSERFRVSFVGPATAMQGAAELYVHFSPSNPNTGPNATPNPMQESVSCRLGRAAAAGASAPIAEEITLESVFVADPNFGCLVPLEILGVVGGDKLTGFVGKQQLVTRGPLSGAPPQGGDNIPPTVLATFDTAPDTGAGRDFVVPGGAAPTGNPTSFVLLTGNAVGNTTSYATATTQAVQFNWTTTLEAADIRLAATLSNGTVSFVVLDAAGATLARQVFAATGNVTVNARDAAPGAWRILVNATAFQGEAAFTIAAPAATSPSSSSSGAPASSSNAASAAASSSESAVPDGGTGSSSGSRSSEKGTPGIGILALLAGVALAVVVRRRIS